MNSDLRLIKDFGEQLKPATEQPPRDLRRRVLTSAARSKSRPASRFAIGLVSAATAVVVMAALILPNVAVGPDRPPVAELGTVQAETPTEVLRLATQNVAGPAELSARPDQFIYTEAVTRNHTDMGQWRAVSELTQVRQWRSVDGSRPGLVQERPLDLPDDVWRPGSAQSDGALPTGGDAMYSYLYRPDGTDSAGANADERAWDRAVELLMLGHSPAVRRAVLTAMGRIPGLTVRTGEVDAAGRPGVAVGYARQTVIFEPSTYRYLGTNRTVEFSETPGKTTTMEVRQAVQRVAVVDNAGDLP